MAEKDLPKRKGTRWQGYDYGLAEMYFVTICVRDRRPILSEITVKDNDDEVGEEQAPPLRLMMSFVLSNP